MRPSMVREQLPLLRRDLLYVDLHARLEREKASTSLSAVQWQVRMSRVTRLIDLLAEVAGDDFLWRSVVDAEDLAIRGDGLHSNDSPDDDVFVQSLAS